MGNLASFWKDVKSIEGKKQNLPKCIDHVDGDKNIVEVWENKYSRILNSLDDSYDRDSLQNLTPELPRTAIHLVFPEEERIIWTGHNHDKGSGSERITAEFFEYSPKFTFEYLTALYVVYYLIPMYHAA